ncbi:hypothetical protein [Pseudoalteromonas maricaloris]|uniref:hypothetical protein n=1 Tax=Pseudoalteromonas maricaloris TaxID=184924 RepID=UPI00029A04E6|nr:hypothetical protein [Pseudoalteromonas flavipulchra]
MKKVKFLDLISRIYFFLFRVQVNTATFKKLAAASVATKQNLLNSEKIQSVVGGIGPWKPHHPQNSQAAAPSFVKNTNFDSKVDKLKIEAAVCNHISGGNSAVKPRRNKTVTTDTNQLPIDMCSLISGGNGAKKPPRNQSIETEESADKPLQGIQG